MTVGMQDLTSLLSPLNNHQKSRLERIQRFLVNIADLDLASRATQVGYDNDEHALGWRLLTLAAGQSRPLEHAMMLGEGQALDRSETRRRLMWLDHFENVWFKRARNAIRRFVSPAQRDQFEQTFFFEMPQQPLGPSVVGSVARFLERVEMMRDSEVEGAEEALGSLVKKGLTEALLAEAREMIEASQSIPQTPDDTARRLDPLREAAAEQIEAYESANLWYNDWADTLRSELDYHDQLRLGLRSPRGGRRATSITPDEDPIADPQEV